MNLTNLLIFLFLLSAFAVGSAVSDNENIEQTLNSLENLNLSEQINITAPPNSNYLTKGMFNTLEAWMNFAIIGALETYKIGIRFGADNPEYFTPEFILSLIKLIIVALVISLLVKPVTYLIVLIILFSLWIKDKLKSKSHNNTDVKGERR